MSSFGKGGAGVSLRERDCLQGQTQSAVALGHMHSTMWPPKRIISSNIINRRTADLNLSTISAGPLLNIKVHHQCARALIKRRTAGDSQMRTSCSRVEPIYVNIISSPELLPEQHGVSRMLTTPIVQLLQSVGIVGAGCHAAAACLSIMFDLTGHVQMQWCKPKPRASRCSCVTLHWQGSLEACVSSLAGFVYSAFLICERR